MSGWEYRVFQETRRQCEICEKAEVREYLTTRHGIIPHKGKEKNSEGKEQSPKTTDLSLLRERGREKKRKVYEQKKRTEKKKEQ